jgi:hypothetical protein
MGDVAAVATAVTSVSTLVDGILTRADADGPKKTLDEDITKVQNGFVHNDLDEQWITAYKLLNDVGHPLTPGGSVGDTDRQFRHNALICIAELKYLKTIIARLNAKRT